MAVIENMRVMYEGPVYARTVSRGIVLESLERQLDEAIEEALGERYSLGGGWTGWARIAVELRDAEVNPHPSDG